MIKCNFSKAPISKPKAYQFVMKEMLSILPLFFLTGNVNVFTSCKQGICDEYMTSA